MYPLFWMLLSCFEKENHNHIYDAGKKVYAQQCATCHQSDGLGRQGVFPPLRGSQWITKDPKLVASIIQYGLGGEIDVAGVTYRSAMPPQELSEQDLYSVVAYVRFAFGEKELDFSMDGIKSVVEKKRGTIYGQAELDEMFP